MDEPERDGRTALHHAAFINDATAVEALLRSGADPNHRDKRGYTPLHFAAQENATAAAQLLISHGADLSLRDSYGNPPLWTAVFNYREDGTMIQMLLLHGADPLAPNNNGKTPRELAHLIANYDVRKYFP